MQEEAEKIRDKIKEEASEDLVTKLKDEGVDLNGLDKFSIRALIEGVKTAFNKSVYKSAELIGMYWSEEFYDQCKKLGVNIDERTRKEIKRLERSLGIDIAEEIKAFGFGSENVENSVDELRKLTIQTVVTQIVATVTGLEPDGLAGFVRDAVQKFLDDVDPTVNKTLTKRTLDEPETFDRTNATRFVFVSAVFVIIALSYVIQKIIVYVMEIYK